jgi:hypothetical protein
MKVKELPQSIYHSFRLRYLQASNPFDVDRIVPIIISLTSIPSRLSTLDIVIASLLEQTVVPQKIILWLNYSLRNIVPKRLQKLESSFFEICYCDGDSSYRKLLPTMKTYHNSIIVTCDDDMMYPKNWLENLYNSHLENKDCVISQVGRLIYRDKKTEALGAYKSWSFVRHECSEKELLPIGYGGVLYPVNTFDDRVFDESLYMKLAPKADDLWFKAMAFLNGKVAYCASEKARPIPIIRSQQVSLNSTNIKQDGNRIQWQALCEHFEGLKSI